VQIPTPSWTARIWSEFHAGNLTPVWKDVLLTLRTFRGLGGTAWPSHATLAKRARCSPSTVLRALKRADELGLVRWAERRVRAGWRWLRTSNVYRFLMPETPVEPTNRQKTGRGERVIKKAARERVAEPSWEAQQAAREALGARRRAFEAMLRGVNR
jgi:DNA-binding transcriptional MocR family regulator